MYTYVYILHMYTYIHTCIYNIPFCILSDYIENYLQITMWVTMHYIQQYL